MSIEICTVCYNFQRRWVAQLSSLVQQINPPDLIINIAYVKGNGNPEVETIVKFYKEKGLKFRLTPYEENIKDRGSIRNLQIENSTEEWLLFNDCDIVYDPNFFNELVKKVNIDCKNVIGFPLLRYTKVENVNRYFDKLDELYIESSYDISKSFGITHTNERSIAAGNGQLVRRQIVMDKGGCYVSKACDKPMGYNRTRSDARFRKFISKEKTIIWGLPAQIHLEHYRIHDKEFDIGAQR